MLLSWAVNPKPAPHVIFTQVSSEEEQAQLLPVLSHAKMCQTCGRAVGLLRAGYRLATGGARVGHGRCTGAARGLYGRYMGRA